MKKHYNTPKIIAIANLCEDIILSSIEFGDIWGTNLQEDDTL